MCFKTICILFSTTYYINSISAQEIHYTQSNQLSILRNPALTGQFNEDIRIGIGYHNQWSNSLAPYQSTAIQLETRFNLNEKCDGLSAGFLVNQDKVGENQLRQIVFLPVLNFHKSLSEIRYSYLNFAIVPGTVNTQFDPTALPKYIAPNSTTLNQTNYLTQAIPKSNAKYLDLSGGISYHSELNENMKLGIGLSAYHFNRFITIASNTYKPNREWKINTDFAFKDALENELYFQTDISRINGINQFSAAIIYGIQLNNRVFEKQTELSMGLFYSAEKNFSPMVQLNRLSTSIAVSYDIYTGPRNDANPWQNTFELTLFYKTICYKKNAVSERLKCGGKR